jgi:hypothetical protein
MAKVTRTIACFKKSADQPLWVRPLVGARLGELRKLFHVPGNDPMYVSYPVTDQLVADRLSRWIGSGRPMDLDRYDYFLECETIPIMPQPKLRGIKSTPAMSRTA